MPDPTAVEITFWHDVDPAIKDSLEPSLFPVFRKSNPNSNASITIEFDVRPDVEYLTAYFSKLSLFDEFITSSIPAGTHLVPAEIFSLRVNICSSRSDIQAHLDASI